MSNLESAIQNLVNRLESVTQRLEKVEGQLGGRAAGGAPASSGAVSQSDSAWLAAFDNLVASHIPSLLEASKKINNDLLNKQVAAFDQAVKAHRAFLNIAAQSKKPDEATLAKLLEPTSKAVAEVIKLRDENRGHALWNHLSTLSEAAPAFGWVSVKPTPGPFVNEYKGNSEFYSNKLRVQYKGKDENQISWINGIDGFLKDLIAFIKQYHTTELSWKANGADASQFASGGAAPSAGGPPPPPAGGPPPPLPAAAPAANTAKSGAPDVNALFAEINKVKDRQAGGKTEGLRHVTADMKSKNQKDKPAAVVSAGAIKTSAAPKAAGPVKKGPAKLELQGNKWVVENYDNNKTLEVKGTEVKHTVYVYKVDNSVLKINGKVNSIAIDTCKRLSVCFDSAIAQVEIVNSNSVEIQCLGKVPSFAIDKCQGVQLYLSKECLAAEIVQSKSDQMNVCIPDGDSGDIKELAIPEQFKTFIKGDKLVTECVEHV